MEKIEIESECIFDDDGWVIALKLIIDEFTVEIPIMNMNILTTHLQSQFKYKMRKLCPFCKGKGGTFIDTGNEEYRESVNCIHCNTRGWFMKNKNKRTKCKHEKHKIVSEDGVKYGHPQCNNKECISFQRICLDYDKYYSNDYLIDSCEKKEIV